MSILQMHFGIFVLRSFCGLHEMDGMVKYLKFTDIRKNSLCIVEK